MSTPRPTIKGISLAPWAGTGRLNCRTRFAGPWRQKGSLRRSASKAGITPTTTVILYGDNNNWFAAWAFWRFEYYGHQDVRLLNGGRKKWLAEGRPLDEGRSDVCRNALQALEPDESLRAYRDQVFEVLTRPEKYNLVDVRSVDEFTGKIIAPPGLLENRAARGTHSRRAEHSLGADRQGRRQLQVAGRPAGRSTRRRASRKRRTPSPTAASASGRATPGSC